MELFKITFDKKKKFYESRDTFELNWDRHVKLSKFYDVTAFKLDWKEREWKCIRRKGPKINYYSN